MARKLEVLESRAQQIWKMYQEMGEINEIFGYNKF